MIFRLVPVGDDLSAVVKRDFARWPTESKAVYGKAVNRAMQEYERYVKQMPPVSARTTGYGNRRGMPTDTNDLRRSIKSKPMPQLGIAAGTYSKIGHAIPVHEGTKRMPARPFFEWALKMGADKIIHNVIEKASQTLPKI